ncbi:MAG: hypothetical protein JWM80_4677 [Cyanobacteria bacterium RYN_339]|nr:hypothetical protein [Cyanobacteria bacterium RYN_339]
MPSPALLSLLVAATVTAETWAPGDISPEIAAQASAIVPLIGLVPLGLSGALGPPVSYVIGPVGLSLVVLGPGTGHFLAGDPWRGAAVSAGTVAIPAATALAISLGMLAFPAVTCNAAAGHCESNPPILPIAGMLIGLGAEIWYYTWAVDDARATAERKNQERRSQWGAALSK